MNTISCDTCDTRGACGACERRMQVGLEVQERFGPLFTEFKGHSTLLASFFAITLLYRACLAVAVGCMAGLNVPLRSDQAKALCGVVVGIQGVFALLMTVLLPQVPYAPSASMPSTTVCACTVCACVRQAPAWWSSAYICPCSGLSR